MIRVALRPPSWTEGNDSDPGIVLVELLAYAAELLSGYQDRVADEARGQTRRRYALALAALAFAFWGWRRCGDAEANPQLL